MHFNANNFIYRKKFFLRLYSHSTLHIGHGHIHTRNYVWPRAIIYIFLLNAMAMWKKNPTIFANEFWVFLQMCSRFESCKTIQWIFFSSSFQLFQWCSVFVVILCDDTFFHFFFASRIFCLLVEFVCRCSRFFFWSVEDAHKFMLRRFSYHLTGHDNKNVKNHTPSSDQKIANGKC